MTRRNRLKELATLFLKLGCTAFGGPAAHLALMEEEVVRKRKWLSREDFLDLWGATNLIPGPNSTEMAIHIGRARAGVPGLLVAGACFIFPAAALTLAVAWAYVRFGTLPQADGFLYGVKPVVLSVMIQALWRLGWTAVKSEWLALLAVLAAAANAAGVNELMVLFGAGAVAVAGHEFSGGKGVRFRSVLPCCAAGAAGHGAGLIGLSGLFLTFLKVGSVLFGSGYVLVAFLRADLVQKLGRLTESQLIDAVAAGQITPGPVFSTATFIGYLLGGVQGAGMATLGIFLPAFVFVVLSAPFISRLRKSRMASALLDGVNAASLALIAVVTWRIGRASLADPLAWVILLAAFVLLNRRVGSHWLVLAGGAAGLLLS